MDELAQTPETTRKRAEQKRLARERLEGLAFIAATPQGCRLLIRLLTELGFGNPAPADSKIELYNFGQALARELAKASPNIFHNITNQIYGI